MTLEWKEIFGVDNNLQSFTKKPSICSIFNFDVSGQWLQAETISTHCSAELNEKLILVC